MINLSNFKFYLSITKPESINWDYLANVVIPNNDGNSKAYNTLLDFPEFIEAIYKSGIIELS